MLVIRDFLLGIDFLRDLFVENIFLKMSHFIV